VFCSKVTALSDGIEATLERLKLQYTPIARLPDALPRCVSSAPRIIA
jgi:hypothetical protein